MKTRVFDGKDDTVPDEIGSVRVEVESQTDGKLTIAASSEQVARLVWPPIERLLVDILSWEDSSWLGSLRLIHLVEAIPPVAAAWAENLGRSYDQTLNREGALLGQTFVWSDGASENTYAVVILDECLFGAILESSIAGDVKNLAVGTVVHELVHVRWGVERIRSLGAQARIAADDWPGLRRELALACWEEFMAERTAENYYKGAFLDDSMDLASGLLLDAVKAVQVAGQEHLERRNVSRFWGTVIDFSSRTLNALGRFLGRLAGRQEDWLTVSDLPGLSPNLVDVVAHLKASLGNHACAPFRAAELSDLESTVERFVTSLGTRIEQQPDRLLVGPGKEV